MCVFRVIGEQSYRDSIEGDGKKRFFLSMKMANKYFLPFVFCFVFALVLQCMSVSCLIIYMLRYAGQYDECMGRGGA